MRIGDIMSEAVGTISSRASAAEARELMERNDIRHLVVMDGARIEGVVSARDLDVRIGDVMSSPVVTADRKTTLQRAANLGEGVDRTTPGASHWEEKHRGRRRSRHVPRR